FAKIARTADQVDDRYAAVKELTDQVALAQVAKTDSDRDVRKAATDKLTDQGALAQIAKTADYLEVRVAAVRRLTDQAVVAEFADMENVPMISLAAAKMLADQTLAQTVFARIGNWADRSDDRLAAVKELTDQVALAQVAKTDSDSDVGKAAADKLTDQAVLADVAKTAICLGVRVAAVRRLTDQAVVAKFAMENVPMVSLAAAKMLAHQTLAQMVFAMIAKRADRSDDRLAAVKELTDQAALAEIAKTNESTEVRRAAADRLTVKVGPEFSLDKLGAMIDEAKEPRDRASDQEWERQGSPGRGQPHYCRMCHRTMYGKETTHGLVTAYRCRSCGSEYCYWCLEQKAPNNAAGGKSCPSCLGVFEVIHG
ncbi:MAG: hypothetical protein LAQ69_09305, partial [Acidobacteriia bacterium]|nr:hypothetical protein [Terriglobia bacterium]